MSTTPIPGYPNASQTEYARITKAPLPGALWEEELWNAQPLSALVPFVAPVAFIKTFTIGNNTPTDVVGLSIAGGEVTVESGADAAATAALLITALDAAGFTASYFASTVDSGGGVITVTGVLGQDPDLVAIEEGATTLTIATTQEAALPLIVCFGEGVTHYDDGTGINTDKVKRPSALTDRLVGVLLRTTGAKIPAGQLAESGLDPLPNVFNALPGQCYSVERADVGVVVEYVGAAPGKLDDVYWICTGDDAGKWAKSDGAGSKVVTLTATSVADGNIGFDYNGLPALSLIATANATNDATSLFALLTGSVAYQELLASSVDNLDGTLTLTFKPGLDPTFTDQSTGTSTVAEAVVTAVVAANAQLVPEYSWGKPSILASADVPARAFLRLSR